MTKQTKNKSGQELIEVYETVTCLEKTYKEMQEKELMTLASRIYNVVVAELSPKRKVLLNELLDAESELRVRTQA
jgi:hypothetical protein